MHGTYDMCSVMVDVFTRVCIFSNLKYVSDVILVLKTSSVLKYEITHGKGKACLVLPLCTNSSFTKRIHMSRYVIRMMAMAVEKVIVGILRG